MNILQILPELNVGGVETGTVDFAKFLVQHKHYSVIVSNGGALVKDVKAAGTKHHILPVHKKSLWHMWKNIKPLRAIIEKENIDIVHARSRVPAWIAYFACRKTKAAFISTCHGYYKNRILSQIMGWSKLVIVPSKVIGRHMIDHFKVSSKSIRCIPRSVDLEKFPIKNKNVMEISKGYKASQATITMIGRITPLKGHTYFLEAMAKVIRVMPQVKIWIVGVAPQGKEYYKDKLEALVARLGIKNHVEFLGNRSDIAQILSKTDVLVMSSVMPESFGRVILEAQASGVAVVATKVGGVVDIIDHNQTGLLVMPKDTEAMAKAVMLLLKDKALCQKLILAAQRKLKENFSLSTMAERTLEVYEELLNSMNILIIKISSVGDVILITAALRAIRKRFPKAKIHCLVGKNVRKVLHNCPYLDGLIVYDPQHKDKGYYGLLKFSRKLRKYRIDKCIDLQNNRKSHLLSFLCFPKESYGYNNGKWGFLLSNSIRDWRKDIGPVAHQFQVLRMLGIMYQENHSLELWPSAKDRQYIKKLLDSEWMSDSKNLVGFNIAASEKWATKNWPVEYLARLCDMLASQNIRVIITGMIKDKPKVKQLLKLTNSKPSVLIGKTDILQLAVLIKKCRVFITSDSAPMHVAAAVQTPFIAFFGPTDSRRHLPLAKRRIVMERKLDCAPCYSAQCRIQTHACMKEITPEAVANEIKVLMTL